jgi:hypothetical protein
MLYMMRMAGHGVPGTANAAGYYVYNKRPPHIQNTWGHIRQYGLHTGTHMILLGHTGFSLWLTLHRDDAGQIG